eukprot:CAMPEP_0202940938 /NCGR_PEP_ID=MMETSP1395-20130829/1069_1 /ASSEMBLY_ACC=CAM_ASM_000871 /TAXON_ID=5961 /ORGANISM="Blepharisma japonicum, Strain Stock R1072" /LENGTH=294 /DNA_ID=CAMNT_0049635745 /DNA_START=402 /DNA_END=1286 /DNA_ORIENTATION=-
MIMVINEERMVILNGKKFGTQNLIANFWKSTELLRIKNGEKKKAKKMIEYEAKNGKKVMTLEKFRHEMSKMRENGGKAEGNKGNFIWNEEWSIENERKYNNKWWSEGPKKWGIKSTVEGISETHEEWEEIGSSKKIKITYDDGFGHKSITTEGYGDDYKYKDEFTEDVSTGEMLTQKQGHSGKETWSSIMKQSPGKFYVHNIGQDTNSSWEETWHEESGQNGPEKKETTQLGALGKNTEKKPQASKSAKNGAEKMTSGLKNEKKNPLKNIAEKNNEKTAKFMSKNETKPMKMEK